MSYKKIEIIFYGMSGRSFLIGILLEELPYTYIYIYKILKAFQNIPEPLIKQELHRKTGKQE